ncbi:MAG: cupredoxin domain-containing protein, partial [Actinomycetota bacterium]
GQGLDVFDPNVTLDPGIPSVALVPKDANGVPLATTCGASLTRLCQRGQATHGQIPTSGNHGSSSGIDPTDWAAMPDGQHLNDVLIGGFTFGLTDQGLVLGLEKVPFIKLGEKITFHNLDTAAYMWHTITRCAAPCTGPTTVDYPIADGGSGSITGAMDVMDFDSTQLGIGTGPSQHVSWGFTPNQTGTFTFFCRVHPSMRGVFRVT